MGSAGAAEEFLVEDATIADIHPAIRSGQTTCQGVVEAHIAPAKEGAEEFDPSGFGVCDRVECDFRTYRNCGNPAHPRPRARPV